MTPVIQPHSWGEFPVECFFYFVPLSIAHIATFVVGSFTIAAFSWKRPAVLIQRIRRLLLFLSLLLLIGSFFNGVWSCAVWGRFYYSTDYVFDFTPFWPITQRVIDMPFGDQRGQLFGVTLTQLNLIWLLFALGTWGTTVLAYRAIQLKRLGGNGAIKSANLKPILDRT